MFKKVLTLVIVLTILFIVPTFLYADGNCSSQWRFLTEDNGIALQYRTCNNGNDVFYIDIRNPNDFAVAVLVGESITKGLAAIQLLTPNEVHSWTTKSDVGFVNWKFYGQRFGTISK